MVTGDGRDGESGPSDQLIAQRMPRRSTTVTHTNADRLSSVPCAHGTVYGPARFGRNVWINRMMSYTRKAEILAAEERFRRIQDLAARLAESGVYLIGPLQGIALSEDPELDVEAPARSFSTLDIVAGVEDRRDEPVPGDGPVG